MNEGDLGIPKNPGQNGTWTEWYKTFGQTGTRKFWYLDNLVYYISTPTPTLIYNPKPTPNHTVNQTDNRRKKSTGTNC